MKGYLCYTIESAYKTLDFELTYILTHSLFYFEVLPTHHNLRPFWYHYHLINTKHRVIYKAQAQATILFDLQLYTVVLKYILYKYM